MLYVLFLLLLLSCCCCIAVGCGVAINTTAGLVHEETEETKKTKNRSIRYYVQGASLRGRHTPPATLAQEGKIV